jgi:hypothetical protein
LFAIFILNPFFTNSQFQPGDRLAFVTMETRKQAETIKNKNEQQSLEFGGESLVVLISSKIILTNLDQLGPWWHSQRAFR